MGRAGIFLELTTVRRYSAVMTPDFWLDCYFYWYRASQGHCVVLCYSVALHDLVTPALGSSESLLRAPVLCCTPVSPSGVIEVRAERRCSLYAP